MDVVAVDVETTGRSACLGHRITEIALVGRVIDEFCVDIDPRGAEAPTFGSVHEEIVARIEHRVVVGHKISFDLEFLAREFERLPGAHLPTITYIDTLALAKKTLDHDGTSWTLSAVATRLDLDPDGPLHTALVDARLALNIFDSLIEYYDKPNLKTLGLRRLIWGGVSP